MVLLIAVSGIETINTFIKKVLKYYVKNYGLFDLLLLFSCWVVSTLCDPINETTFTCFLVKAIILWKYLIRELHETFKYSGKI